MLNRRLWLTRSLYAIGTLSLSAVCDVKLPQSSAQAAELPVRLTPNPNLSLFRVRMELDLEGNVNVPSNALVSRKSETKLPIKSDAIFDYEERFRRPADADLRSEITTSERYYHEAKSTSRLSRRDQTATLRDSVRHAIVRRDMLPEVVYGVDDYLTQHEVDLLKVPASSIMVDSVLPKDAVTQGTQYAVDQQALVSLLNLASIQESDVLGEVVEITPEAVKLQLRGKVSGTTDGVPTVVRVVGKLTFDRQLATTTWLAMALHETREIGKAEPGFDIAATIKMIRKPLDKPIALPATPAAVAITEPIPQDRMLVELASREIGLTTLMDRRWRIMSDVPGSAMMRMIENDRSIAQCDFRPLADLKPGQQWTLEAFQADVRRTLGERLSQLVEGDERLSDSGLRVLRITAAGSVQGVGVQWVMLHFSDDSGRRILATFTMDSASVDAFAGSDVQLANSLRMTAKQPAAAAGTVKNAGSQEPESVAKMNAKKSDTIQSASDLRRGPERR